MIFSWTTRSEDRKYDNVQRLIVRCIYLNNIEMETNFKWLVYKTTNKKNGKYYIGISYEDPNNIDKDFLGSGIYKNDPYTYQYSKTLLQWAVKTDGVNNFDRIILTIHNNEKDALYTWQKFINEKSLENRNIYNSYIIPERYGWYEKYLTKITIYKASGQKITDYWEYVQDSDKKYPHFKILESALSGCLIKTKYKIGKESWDNYTSAILYDSESLDHAKKMWIQNRPVFKYNGKTGEFIEAYNTQVEAEKANKYSNITKSIKLKTPDKNGFMWAIFKADYYNIPDEKTIKLIEKRERNQAKFAISKAKRRERLGLKPRS